MTLNGALFIFIAQRRKRAIVVDAAPCQTIRRRCVGGECGSLPSIARCEDRLFELHLCLTKVQHRGHGPWMMLTVRRKGKSEHGGTKAWAHKKVSRICILELPNNPRSVCTYAANPCPPLTNKCISLADPRHFFSTEYSLHSPNAGPTQNLRLKA